MKLAIANCICTIINVYLGSLKPADKGLAWEVILVSFVYIDIPGLLLIEATNTFIQNKHTN